MSAARAGGPRLPYFAFGSNLDAAQMARRCPGARVVGHARLEAHRLGFAGWSPTRKGAVATVLPDAGASVMGVLYRLEAEDLGRLDAAEGHPWFYERRRVRVRAADGRYRAAWTYVLDAEPGLPAAAYLTLIARAYARLGFALRPLYAALEAS